MEEDESELRPKVGQADLSLQLVSSDYNLCVLGG